MEINTELILLIGSVLFIISMLVGKAGHRFGVPVLLLFLVVGMVFGRDGFGLPFENISFARTIGTVCLSIILFSGGLDTRFSDIKSVIAPGVILATAGVFLTSFITGFFIWWLFGNMFTSIGVGLLTSMLLSSTTSSTDSASVFGILRSKGVILRNNLKPLLELESGSNDPVAYMLTMAFITIIQSGQEPDILLTVIVILLQIAVGALVGYFSGKVAVRFINRIRMENSSLYPILLFIIGIFIFSATYFLKGNGFLAVYIAGLAIGNSRFVHKRSSMKFMDGMAWMCQILLFLTLGLLANPLELIEVIIPALLIAVFLIFVARPVTVFLCLSPFLKKIKFRDQLFISWVGLRGAAPIIFAIFPLAYNVPNARLIFNIVFVITIVSLLVQGTSLPLVARWLGLADSPENHKKLEDFDVEFSEDIKSAMTEILISADTLAHGKNLIEMPLPDRTLVVMIKRDEQYFVPTGQTELKVDDKLLVITDDERALKETYRTIGISEYSYQKNK